MTSIPNVHHEANGCMHIVYPLMTLSERCQIQYNPTYKKVKRLNYTLVIEIYAKVVKYKSKRVRKGVIIIKVMEVILAEIEGG